MAGEQDKRVLLVGAGGDIGIETAIALCESGYMLCCAVRDQAEEDRVRERIGGDAHRFAHIDLSDAEAMGPAIDALLDGWDGLAAVVNCAGVAPFGPMAIAPIVRLKMAMEVNVYSSIVLFQHCFELLRRQGGRFVITSSASAFFAVPFLGYYATTKRALESAADAMRVEARRSGVDVVLIQPGRVSTQMGRRQLVAITEEYNALPNEQRAAHGFLYRGFHAVSSRSEDEGSGIPARMVGDAILAAITTPHPQARYRVGEDADQAWTMRSSLDDKGFDDWLTEQFLSGS